MSDYVTRIKAQQRRTRNTAASRCINHDRRPAEIGVRCADCVARHLRLDLYDAGHRAHLMSLRLGRELRLIGAA